MIGIDLGTTNCTVAIDGKIAPIEQQIDRDLIAEKPTLPSFYEEGVVGHYARERSVEVPDQVIHSAKSWLAHAGIDRRSPILKGKSPLEVCGAYLKHIKKACHIDDQTVFLTVPASFDPSARQLVQEAAELAGYPSVVLLEEPLAAFYAWLAKHEEDWRQHLKVGDTVLVVDSGGGTTDFSLITVQEREGNLELERKAVGEHLLLGGDNMDLALAYMAKEKFAVELDEWQFTSLVHVCRQAKEKLLAENAPDQVDLTIPGRGSSLIGGALTATMSRDEVQQLLVEGFFPLVPFEEQVERQPAAGLSTLALPYVRDPRITAQLANFLLELPTAILFNGGTMKADAFQKRLLQQLAMWGADVKILPDADLDFGVSLGAAYYGKVRAGQGIRVRAGTARSYYIGVEGAAPAVPGIPPPLKAVCIVPFGMEEGSSVTLDETFSLTVNQPAIFRFFAHPAPNEVGKTFPLRELQELHPIETVLKGEGKQAVLVKLTAKVTELGVLELWCGEWKLEFDLRSKPSEQLASSSATS